MPRKRKDRVYTRERNGVLRYYADFRDYEDIGGRYGGKRVALVPEGQHAATTDGDVARQLEGRILRQLESQRRGLLLTGDVGLTLKRAAAQMLVAAARSEEKTTIWLKNATRMLRRAVRFFNEIQPQQDPRAWARRKIPPGPRQLTTITPPDVRAFAEWVRGLSNGRGGKQSQQSVRHHVSALSSVYAWAISEGHLPMVGSKGQGSNPVTGTLGKPPVPRSRTPLREPEEVALLIEAARTFDPDAEGLVGGARPIDCLYELVAFFAYTGAREDEIRRVDVRDLHFTSPLGPWVLIRGADKGRGDRSAAELERIVPMHPHLVEILRAYVRRLGRISGPLFQGRDGQPFGTWTKALDRIAARCGYEEGEIRTRQFRVAYATHRCTCDGVDANQVRLELGWTDLSMMATVYARAQRRSERMGPELSYRLERWEHRIEEERLLGLQETPKSTREIRAEERAAVARAFLAAVEGWSGPKVKAETGVDDAVLNRLRSGAQRDVKGKTLQKMRSYLDGRRQAAGAA